MKKIFKLHKINKIILFLLVVYSIYHYASGKIKLQSYNSEKKYYEEQISALNEEKNTLTEAKENINSPEYVENIAREKLDMYLPNERVYIDVSK